MFDKFKLMLIKVIFIWFEINVSVRPSEGLQTLRFMCFSTLMKLSSSSLRCFYSLAGVHLSFGLTVKTTSPPRTLVIQPDRAAEHLRRRASPYPQIQLAPRRGSC